MSESRQERWARSVVERSLGVGLEFVDTDGRVDYRFIDPVGRRSAMEVTTFTDRQLKVSVDTYNRTRSDIGPLTSLGSCWSVCVDERDTTFRGLESSLEKHLVLLEDAGIEHGRWLTPAEVRAAYRTTSVVGSVSDSVAVFEQNLVRLLMRWLPQTCAEEAVRHGQHSHGVQLSTTGSFVPVGADVALETIETFVATTPDNLRKLSESGAEVKHLFIGLDEETTPSVSHSVSPRFAAPADNGIEHFGLPSRDPSLPAEVDHLWVVYEREGQGWHWGDGRWEQVDAGQ